MRVERQQENAHKIVHWLKGHAYLTVEERERLGITDNFLRLSVGIENVDDLIEDLQRGLREG